MLGTRPEVSRQATTPRLPGVGAAILGIAFVGRVLVVLATRHLPMRDDSADYARLGVLLAHSHTFGSTVLAAGGGPTAFRAPAYPLFVGLIFRLTGDSITAVRLVQAALGTLTVALIGLVVAQLFDRRHGLVAAALAAVYPPLILLGNGLLTEGISLPLETGVLAAALTYRRRLTDIGAAGATWLGPALLAGCGLMIGLAIETRPVDGILVIPVVLLIGTRADRAVLGRAAVVVGVVVVTLVPWEIRDAHAFHRLVPVSTQDGYVLAGVYNAQAAHDPAHPAEWRSPAYVPALAPLFHDLRLNESRLNDALRRRAQAYALAHPAYVAHVVATSTVDLFGLSGMGDAEIAAGSVGYGTRTTLVWVLSSYAACVGAVVGALMSRSRAVPLAVWLVPALFVLATVPTLGTLRYRSPIEPYLVMFSAVAVMGFADRVRSSRHQGADVARPG